MYEICNTASELQRAYFWLTSNEMKEELVLLGMNDKAWENKQEMGDWLMSEVVGNLTPMDEINKYLRKAGYENESDCCIWDE